MRVSEASQASEARRGAGITRALLIVSIIAMASLGAAPACIAATPPKSAAALAEFWFVEANEGQSAGGHAALRLGPRVYHLEHRGDGLIADRRTSPRRFIEVYADRGNRRIEAIPLDLSEEQVRALKTHLAMRFSTRTRRLAALDGIEDEIRWLESVAEAGVLTLRIPGLGLFETPQRRGVCAEGLSVPHDRKDETDVAFTVHPGAQTPSAQSLLGARLTHRFGHAKLLDRKIAARRRVEAQLDTLLRRTDEAQRLPESVAEHGGRLRPLIQAARTEFALGLLLGCEGALRPDALVRTQTPLGNQRGLWIAAQDQLAQELGALLNGPRTDIGLPLLLGWARLAAIAETLASNQIHVLAPFEEYRPENARAFTQSSVSVAHEVPSLWQAPRKAETDARWMRSLTEFAGGKGPLEARLLALERAHHALRHFEDHTLHDPIRPESRSPSPAEAYASASRLLPWPSGARFSAVLEERLVLEQAALSLRRSLDDELRYGLFTRNCVSELSAALEMIRSRTDRANPSDGGGDGGTFGTTTLFSGHRGRLSAREVIQGAFIPEVAALRVEALLATQPRRSLMSTRERALLQARSQIESPLARWLFEGSESITLTSQTYQPNQDDSRFLLFSDGPIALRPLIGLTNLGYGVAASFLGLIEAPFDRGVGLRRGIQGIAMSVPELFFFQVRQGSYRVAPPRALTPSEGSTETR